MGNLKEILKLHKTSSESFINDRRRGKRYELPLKVTCDETSEQTLTKNISKTGLRFPLKKRIPEGSLIELTLEDPYSNVIIRTKGKVVWVDDFIIGNDAEDVICEVGVKLFGKNLF